MTDSRAWFLTKQILAAIQARYATDAVPLPARQFVTAGLVIYDAEQLSVTLIRQFGIDDNGAEGDHVQRCLVWRGAEYEIMLLRCAPTVDMMANGEIRAPSAVDYEAYGALVSGDAARIVQSLLDALDADWFGMGPVLTLESWNATNEADLGGGVMRMKLSLV